jgi:hypothetical protein
VAASDDMPRLPVRAAVYLLPDGNVQFGALFEELIPVARALGEFGTPSASPERTNSDGFGAAAQAPSATDGESR